MRIQGEWYIPVFDKRYFGTLVKEDNKITLHLIANLPNYASSVRFPIINGKTIDGEFTLLDCIWKNNFKHRCDTNITESRLTCYSMIRQYCFSKEEELLFNRFKFNFYGLREWANKFDVSDTYDRTEIKVTHKQVENVKFKLNNDIIGILTFESFQNSGINEDSIYDIRQYVYIDLISEHEKELESLLKMRDSLLSFFSIFLQIDIQPYIQRLFSYKLTYENRSTEPIELIYIQNKEIEKKNTLDKMKYFIRFNHIENEFQFIMDSWILHENALFPIVNILNYLLKRELSIGNRFLLVSQALETYHSRFRQKNEIYSKSEKNKHGSPKFQTRVKYLLNYFHDSISSNYLSQSEFDAFPEIIKDTRDYYTHYLDQLKNKIWDESNLLTNTPKLIMILYSLIYKEIGVPDKVIIKFLNNNGFGVYSDIKDIPIPILKN